MSEQEVSYDVHHYSGGTVPAYSCDNSSYSVHGEYPISGQPDPFCGRSNMDPISDRDTPSILHPVRDLPAGRVDTAIYTTAYVLDLYCDVHGYMGIYNRVSHS